MIEEKLYRQILDLPDDIDIYDDIIELFSYYIASNKNFKYNVTYLTDSKYGFYENIKLFKLKYNLVKKIGLNLSNFNINIPWTILIDDFFIISNQTYKVILADNITLNNKDLGKKINTYRKDFYLYNLTNNKITVRILINNDDLLTSFNVKDFSNISEINNFINTHLSEYKEINNEV